jgi:hypothetical protein
MSSVVSTGEAAAIASDVRSIVDNLRTGSTSGTDAVSALNAAAAVAQALASNPLTQALGLTAVGLQLASEQARLQAAIAAGNKDATVDALLGIVGAAGGIIAAVPSPQTKAIGVALAIASIAAKDLYRNRQAIGDLLDDMSRPLGDPNSPLKWVDPQTAINRGLIDPKTLLPRVPSVINDVSRAAFRPRPRDPLAIDLDGDGIETVGIPATGSPVLFDHNADGIRTGTGWLKGDDAWLVLDRNGNGSIDSGLELFGVDTDITVTEPMPGSATVTTFTRKAYTGFEALRAQDTNRDGVLNTSDAAFGQVRLWQDLNGDGISQAGELNTLAAKGITSIALNETAANTNLGNGNSITGTATVRRSSGADTHIDAVGLTASNLNLSENPFYRQFPDQIPLTAAAKSAPEMGGSGWLRDLREAMSLGSSAAGVLQSSVNTFAAQTTRTEQRARVDALVAAWAQTST